MTKHNLKHKKPQLWSLVTALAVVVAAMVLLSKCSHKTQPAFDNGLPPKSGGDTLDVAIEISPLSYSLANDTVSGLDYDILNQMAAQRGRAVKFHPFAPLDYAMTGLEQGVFDIVVSSLPATSDLKRKVLLTNRVYLDYEVLVQRNDATKFVKEAHGLAHDSVWISAGSPFISRIRNLSSEIGDTIVIVTNHPYTSEHLTLMVANGQLPRAVVNHGLAKRIAKDYPMLNINTAVSFTQFQTWAVNPKNQALCDTLNTWLHNFQNTPQYTTLLNRYNLAE